MVQIPGTKLNVSAICYGTGGCGTRLVGSDMDAVLDAFVGQGGNFFDTAHCYAFWLPNGNGASERALGDYVRRREIRERVVIATKCAHTPAPRYRDRGTHMSAECVRDDLTESLDRLQMDYVDMLWLHRDDVNVPVAEIVEFMNAEVKQGRIRCFGASNWSGQRIDEANEFAVANGLMGFAGSQPHFSLARVESMPDGMRQFDEADALFHRRSKIPVIPYSPTAKGFFATRGERGGERRNLAPNIKRLKRVQTLAAEIGVSANQVAVAWLMNQPFPVVPILGTGNPEHLIDGMGAAQVTLSTEQVAWLNLDSTRIGE